MVSHLFNFYQLFSKNTSNYNTLYSSNNTDIIKPINLTSFSSASSPNEPV